MLRRLGDHVRERQGGIVFDLWSANLAQLESYGVRDIEVAGICTKCGGRDLWSYRAPRGGSIRKALDYLAPYVDPRRKWPGRQITPTEPDLLVLPLEQARLLYGDPRYDALLRRIPQDAVRSHRAQLLYPEQDSVPVASRTGS